MRDQKLLTVLDQALEALRRSGIPHGLIGGIASVVLGRARWTRSHEDIDFFVRHEDADVALQTLSEAGFETEEHNPQWIFKATKDGVLVDVIFRSTGDIYMDEEMIDRIREEEFRDRRVPLISPEDLLVMKALAHDEETFSYWHDALSLLTREDLDWEYLLRRARRHGPRRILSLLLYAGSVDLVVPADVMDDLYRTVRAGS